MTCVSPADTWTRRWEQLRIASSAEKRMIPARPTKGWIGLMCRGLGELPDSERPTVEEFPDARRYRILPSLTILIPLTCAFVALGVLPAALMSPVTATGHAVGGDEGQLVAGQVVIILVLALVLGLLSYFGPTRLWQALFQAALEEELIFRLGAEDWSHGRRVRSCAQFGVAHLLNLIVAVVTLGGLALVGGVFMWVYLREVRESGDPRRAAIVSAHFHARYNVTAAALIVAVGGLYVASMLTLI